MHLQGFAKVIIKKFGNFFFYFTELLPD